MKKINFQPGSLPILTLMNDISEVRRGGLDLQPDYQRNFVWNDEFKDKLLLSLAKRYPIGNITIRKMDNPNSKGARQEVVDGQQRLTTIYNFISNEYEIGYQTSKEILDETYDLFSSDPSKEVQKVFKKYKNNKKFNLNYSNIPNSLKRMIDAFPLSVTSISDATDNQVAEYFRFVQNQERLRAGEILNSLPESILEKYLMKINNKDKLLKVLNFPDSRMEFDKIFYSIIGLLDKKINFGVTDNIIKNYVSEKKDDLSKETLIYVNRMINGLNKISELPDQPINTNKRYLKFLLLLLAFDYIDINKIENVLYELNIINIKLSSFNSAKKDIVKETFNGEEELIEDYRSLALISKGAHPFERVKERMKIVKKIIESANKSLNDNDIDTILVAAEEKGFTEVFLKENCWYAVAISTMMINKIKYIAVYQKRPIKAVTYYAEVDRIEPYKDTGKYIIYFKKKAKKTPRAIPLNPKNPNRTPQGRVYTNISKILNATSKTTVDDLF